MSRKKTDKPEEEQGRSVSGKKWDYVDQPEGLEEDDNTNQLDQEQSQEDEVEQENELSEFDAMTKEEIIAELQAVTEESEQRFDQLVRAQAQVKNVQHTTGKDVENARKFALTSFVQELVTVVDNLERTLDSADEINKLEGVQSFLEGIELTHKSLLATFERFGVTAMDPLGEVFNPEFHEAMSIVPNEDCEPNTVIKVLQKGYLLNQRLIRPAMVIVLKKIGNRA